MCSPSGRELAIRKRPLASHHIYEQATVVNVQLAALLEGHALDLRSTELGSTLAPQRTTAVAADDEFVGGAPHEGVVAVFLQAFGGVRTKSSFVE